MTSSPEFSSLPHGWVWTNIGEISEKIQYGYTASAVSEPPGPRLLRITDIQNDCVNWEKVPYCSIDSIEKQKYFLNDGDIVFARTGATVGKSFLIRGKIPDAVFASYLIRLILSKHVQPEFISNFFRSGNYWLQIKKGQVGIGQPNVNSQILSKISIPLAPLNEQKRIVYKVEELFSFLDAGVESLRKVQAQLKRYRQAVLKNAFEGNLTAEWRKTHKDEGDLTKLEESAQREPPFLRLPKEWTWVSIDKVGELISGQHILSENYNSESIGVPYLTGPADFGESNPLITKWTNKPKVFANLGDVLITVKGAGVGKANILNIEKVAISRQLMAIRSEVIEPDYLFRYVQFTFDKIQKLSQGSTVPGIRREELLNLLIPLCSRSEQKKVVDEIENKLTIILESNKAVGNGLKVSERLRQSLLKKAFEGKLIPQNPNDESAEKLLERIKAEQIKNSEPKVDNQSELSRNVK